jgi:hypothetical protein
VTTAVEEAVSVVVAVDGAVALVAVAEVADSVVEIVAGVVVAVDVVEDVALVLVAAVDVEGRRSKGRRLHSKIAYPVPLRDCGLLLTCGSEGFILSMGFTSLSRSIV